LHAAVQDLPGDSVYDYIVSGLPLNNFTADQVRAIFATYNRLLKPDGTLTYYEYVLARQIQTPFVGRRERRPLFRPGRPVGGYLPHYPIPPQPIFLNLPPPPL